jgi:hypothetical protein
MDILVYLQARKYLAHCYELDVLPILPLADEPFVRQWEFWFENPMAEEIPLGVKDILSDGKTASWLEKTPAGRIPVIFTKSRTSFERAADILYPGFTTGIPASVNAFTIKAKHPALSGHRIILLNHSGYSSLSGKELEMEEGVWLEKSMTLRLHHEICHYFSLRVLGGMKNHALDEIAADCVGQLAAFGTFKASFQRLFFGISKGGVLPGGRFFFYVKMLHDASVNVVLEETEAALRNLENYFSRNSDMILESNRPCLIAKLLTAGISGICGL